MWRLNLNYLYDMVYGLYYDSPSSQNVSSKISLLKAHQDYIMHYKLEFTSDNKKQDFPLKYTRPLSIFERNSCSVPIYVVPYASHKVKDFGFGWIHQIHYRILLTNQSIFYHPIPMLPGVH